MDSVITPVSVNVQAGILPAHLLDSIIFTLRLPQKSTGIKVKKFTKNDSDYLLISDLIKEGVLKGKFGDDRRHSWRQFVLTRKIQQLLKQGKEPRCLNSKPFTQWIVQTTNGESC